ncbi:MAG: hypothetical protein VB108_02375 [Anaerolineaceae bacterium]|nr:hypothetical protein [Anaerolineaceae bacterium]
MAKLPVLPNSTFKEGNTCPISSKCAYAFHTAFAIKSSSALALSQKSICFNNFTFQNNQLLSYRGLGHSSHNTTESGGGMLDLSGKQSTLHFDFTSYTQLYAPSGLQGFGEFSLVEP